MATYSKVCFVELPGVGTVHAGTSTNPKWLPYTYTTSGQYHAKQGKCTSLEAEVVWDASTGTSTISPAVFDKLWLWTDAVGYIQLISTSGATNVIHNLVADDPFTLPNGDLLAAANATAMSAGAQSVTPIRKVVLATSTSGGMNYHFVVAY